MNLVERGPKAMPDPVERFKVLTEAGVTARSVVEGLAIERAKVLAEMHAAGQSYAQIAERVGLTRARAQQLVERGRKHL